jgi:hypothetical protein
MEEQDEHGVIRISPGTIRPIARGVKIWFLPRMQRIARIGAFVAATGLLLVPAIWNGFPLLQYDTGGYLARWFEGTLEQSRSTVYGLFLSLLAQPDFWLAILVQAALTVWMLGLTLRAFGFGGRPGLLPGVTAVLAVLTTLPWLASILLTDIFAGLAVLGLYLLVFAEDTLRRAERYAVIALVAFSAAAHSATFAVALALVAAAAPVRVIFGIGSPGGIARGAGALALGALMLVAANYAVAGRVAWTPGGPALVFGRMLQDGIVARYLADRCPDPRLKLCQHRSELPDDADVFFWGQGIFDRLGRFDGLGAEMHIIVMESLRDYPALQAQNALVAAARQLVRVGSGEGVLNTLWHSYAIVEKFVPSATASMREARQQRAGIDFASINRIHEPVALGAMLLLLPVMLLGYRQERFADVSRLAAAVALALLANAVVCGVLANPHDRYGARLAWLAPMVVMLAAARLATRQRSAVPA